MKPPLFIIPTRAAAALAGPFLAQDRSGPSDAAGLPRFEGAKIRGYRQPSLNEIVIPTGAIADENHLKAALHPGGEAEHVDYVVRPAVAPIAVDRYYRAMLEGAGCTTVLTCTGEGACGPDRGSLILNSGKVAPTGLADGIFSDKMRVIVARRRDHWVLMHTNTGSDAAHIYVASITGATEASAPDAPR
ncbi:hypothetical protein V474_14035 [Novosphingobium barchaimii LL02]|uniref:Uncharacterized protein n=1 Tax=Novosphingobium barchaimii LL02 TaxID=1114963 RepID=A0A0J7XYL0_9SPHN|nr:hypothetical protein [Novosphingobium barchaimii]KMS56624.1 hypothetical protein V474_14035 [Novosphingobium barchaimii LL02]